MNKKILITGASRGLGLYMAKKYLEDGEMVFTGARDINAPLLKALKEEYPNMLIHVELEVTDTKSVNEAATLVRSYTETIDMIVNNAAIHSETSFQSIEEADIDECMQVYDVNSLGPLRVVKAFLPLLRKSSQAKIISISSESGSIESCKREKEFDYCMSKAALNMGTKLLSNYLRKDKVIVLVVHPGWMRTDMGGPNAQLDPYETACQLTELFNGINTIETPIFIDKTGKQFPW